MRGGTSSRFELIVCCVLLALVGYLILPAVGVLFFGSATDSSPGTPPHFTFATLAAAYGRHTIYPSLLNSVLYAASTATLVLLIGGFLAWLVERTDSSVRSMTDLFAVAPILMPAVLLISGWILLLGPRAGLVNLIARDHFGIRHPVINLFSFPGMVWVGMLQELPLAFLWLWPAFRSMNPDLEEAGLASGATVLTVVRRITIPILLPSFLAAWIIFFIYSLGALSVPLLIGLPARIFLYSTEVYLAYRRVPTDFNLASAYSLLFLVVTVVGILAYRWAISDSSRFVTVTGKGYKPRLVRLGRWQPAVTAFAVALLLCVAGLPVLVLVWNAFMPYPQAPSLSSLHLFTTKNFGAAINYGPAVRAVENSVVLGIGAGIITTIIGALIAWASLRFTHHRRLVALLDQLATATIAVPGMIFGVGLLWLYLVMPIGIYGTPWILLLAYIAIHLPFAVRICLSGFSQLHPELEEAAHVSGAGRVQTLGRIVLMLAAPSLMVSVLYVALRSFREYTASIFLTAPGNEVFSVLVLDMWDGGNSNILSAYVTMVIAAFAVGVLVFYWAARRIGVRT